MGDSRYHALARHEHEVKADVYAAHGLFRKAGAHMDRARYHASFGARKPKKIQLGLADNSDWQDVQLGQAGNSDWREQGCEDDDLEYYRAASRKRELASAILGWRGECEKRGKQLWGDLYDSQEYMQYVDSPSFQDSHSRFVDDEMPELVAIGKGRSSQRHVPSARFRDAMGGDPTQW